MRSRSSDPALDALTARAVREIGTHLRDAAPPFIVIIDGRSGAGKTTVARQLAATAPSRCEILSMDEVYPGWTGLRRASAILEQRILPAYRRREPARVPVWDWDQDAWGSERVLDPHALLIVEGAGALTRATAPSADVTVWIDGAVGERRRRALERDGDTYRPHWDAWAAQEDAHIAAEDPAALATLRYQSD